MAENEPILTEREKLRADIREDIIERADWREKRLRLRRARLGERKKNVAYRNAPNFLDPIIDDNVRSITSSENQIVWSGRNLAHFLPLNDQAVRVKRHAENAFNTLLQFGINIHAKIESLLDMKNSDGMSIAKMLRNDTDYQRIFGEQQTIPDFTDRESLEVIVPVGTREIHKSSRIVDILKLTELEFDRRARRNNWKNSKEVKAACRRLPAGEHGNALARSEEDGAPFMIGLDRSNPSEDVFIIWEIYHETANGDRKVTIMCPDAPNIDIHEFPWEWDRAVIETVIEDTLTGDAEGFEDDITVPIRRWPFFQFRFEGRTRDYYDVRGASEMTEDFQKASTQFMNVRAMHFDFFGMPLLQSNSATANLSNFRWRPGEKLPEGVSIASLPSLDPSLDFSIERERATAARRVGGTQGGLLSAQVPRERKTATEVQREALLSSGLSSDAVRRFAEPFSELFNEMWLFLKHNPIPLPMIDSQLQFRGIAPQSIFNAPFIVIASPNARTANPDFVLQQLTLLQPYFADNPHVDIAELTQIVVDQIDPHLTDRVVLDPEAQGTSGVPLVQTVQGLQGAVEQMGQQLQAQGQFLQALIQEQQIEEQVKQRTGNGQNPDVQATST